MEVVTASAQIFARVFGQMRPRTALPSIDVEFRTYANANAQIRLEDGRLIVRMADTLAGAPEPVIEALAEILLSKLFRRPVPAASSARYRRYLNRSDIRRSLDLVRQIRGRKRIDDPQGDAYDLNQMFEELNFRYFFGLMARPRPKARVFAGGVRMASGRRTLSLNSPMRLAGVRAKKRPLSRLML